MIIELETPAYNSRRYNKPWIATVDFRECSGEFHWGNWIGAPGEEGLLQIECEPGDIVARGQKDTRGPGRNSAPSFYVVTEDGELERLPSRAAAYKLWRETEQQRSVVTCGGGRID